MKKQELVDLLVAKKEEKMAAVAAEMDVLIQAAQSLDEVAVEPSEELALVKAELESVKAELASAKGLLSQADGLAKQIDAIIPDA